jgi:hypothetical protein
MKQEVGDFPCWLHLFFGSKLQNLDLKLHNFAQRDFFIEELSEFCKQCQESASLVTCG